MEDSKEDSQRIDEMSETQFEEWLQRSEEAVAPTSCEDTMAATLTDAMRADTPSDKADAYLRLANLAMAAADNTLGSHGRVTTALTVTLH